MRRTEERSSKKTRKVLRTSKSNMKGITLIALVITIVVLLILAGITISTLTGDNGILTKATTSKENTIIGNEKEAIKVSYNGAKANNLGQTVTASELKSELDRNGYRETTVTGTTTLRIKFEETGHIYTIKTDGEIAMNLPGDKDPDKKIVETLGDGIALTESGKVVTLGAKMTKEELTQIFIEIYNSEEGTNFTTFEELMEYKFDEGDIDTKYNDIEEYARRSWI